MSENALKADKEILLSGINKTKGEKHNSKTLKNSKKPNRNNNNKPPTNKTIIEKTPKISLYQSVSLLEWTGNPALLEALDRSKYWDQNRKWDPE